MRTLARIGAPIGFVVAVFVGVVAVVLNQQFDAVQSAADASPQPRTAAELIREGPGKNANIVLSEFRFGEPGVEAEGATWQRVSVPILPAHGKIDKPAHQLVLRVFVQDSSEIEDLRQQATLNVLAATSLSTKSVWGQMAKKSGAKADPRKDQAKTIVLVAASFSLAQVDLLEGEDLFQTAYSPILWGAAGGGFTLALLCVCWAWSIPGPPSRLPAYNQTERDRLANQPPISVHHFKFWAYFLHSWQFYVAPIFLFFGVFGVSVAFDQLADPATMEQGRAGIVFTTLSLLGAWGFMAWAFRKRWCSPAEVRLYPDGLRWRSGGKWDAILWSDVQSVSRGETVTMRAGAVADYWGETTLILKDGRVLRFQPSRYSEYNFLANHIQTSTGQVIVLNKAQQFATTGSADFGPIAIEPAGIVLKGGWLWKDTHQPWSNIKGFEVDNGHLIIHWKDYWFLSSLSIRLADIPDYLALLALLESGGQRARAEPMNFLPAPTSKPTAAS